MSDRSAGDGLFARGQRERQLKIKIAAATILCLMLAAFFTVLQAQPAARYLQAPAPPSDADSRSVWDGVYTNEQADRGHSVYHSQCEVCHGETLLGGDEVPPLAGPQFLANWNGLTVGDLFERIRKSMPANDPGKLSSQQNADVLAYLFSFNEFPAGKMELPHDAELLKQIRIEATKRHDDK
jgi:S-disulfanyl-L-cysteine oxidoreductase SoxD